MLGKRTHPPPRIPSRRQVSDHILRRNGFRGKSESSSTSFLLYFPVAPPFKDERYETKKRGAHVALFPPNARWRPWVHAPKKRFGHTRRRKRDERQERTKREKREHER